MSSHDTLTTLGRPASLFSRYLACWLFSAAALASGCATSAPPSKAPAVPSQAVAPAERAALGFQPKSIDLRPREQLPLEAREMLTGRMMRHGDDMGELTVAVLMLEYDLTHVLAADMAAEPKLGRPAKGESGTLNALLPSEFFIQQDALAASAKALADAAEKRDDARIAASFGEVAKACVGCHSAYLNAALDPPVYVNGTHTVPCEPGEACGESAPR